MRSLTLSFVRTALFGTFKTGGLRRFPMLHPSNELLSHARKAVYKTIREVRSDEERSDELKALELRTTFTRNHNSVRDAPPP